MRCQMAPSRQSIQFFYLISEKRIIPAKMTTMKTYCSTDNLSLRMILDNVKDIITVPAPRITAAIPDPSDNAKKKVAWPPVSNKAASILFRCPYIFFQAVSQRKSEPHPLRC